MEFFVKANFKIAFQNLSFPSVNFFIQILFACSKLHLNSASNTLYLYIFQFFQSKTLKIYYLFHFILLLEDLHNRHQLNKKNYLAISIWYPSHNFFCLNILKKDLIIFFISLYSPHITNSFIKHATTCKSLGVF